LKRNGIFERDGFRCVYCGGQFIADELTLDHVQPRTRGGDSSEGNLVTACRACNTLKGHHRLSAFLHETPVMRENFFRYASSVWPRLLRTVHDELAELDTRTGAHERKKP
jgi:5-methylcytosine-specific restriction endonuclease McrA